MILSKILYLVVVSNIKSTSILDQTIIECLINILNNPISDFEVFLISSIFMIYYNVNRYNHLKLSDLRVVLNLNNENNKALFN